MRKMAHQLYYTAAVNVQHAECPNFELLYVLSFQCSLPHAAATAPASDTD